MERATKKNKKIPSKITSIAIPPFADDSCFYDLI